MGDTTFPTIAEQTNGRARLPTIKSILPAFRSTPAMDPGPAKAAAPPAMKRSRGGQGLRPTTAPPAGPTPAEARLNRDLRSMEINGGDKLAEVPVRRSSRLHQTTNKATTSRVTTREKRSTRSQSVTSSASGQTESNPVSLEAQTAAAVDDWLRDVVRRCARAYRALSLYRCNEALLELDALPNELQATPWALEVTAKSFYHMAEYKKGQRAFKKLVQAQPYGLASMDLYSTMLWHLNDAKALSHLSQTLMSIDRESPQAWIAAGNTFSLLGQHDEASRCFRRATQVDPGCSTAWTLCGHEAWSMDETDRAIAFYRTAIRTDDRDQAAWYGLARVYTKMGKPRHAEHHFRRAAEINPSSAALLCCLGEAMEKSGNYVGALAEYDRAAALDHGAERPMTQYNRARALVALGRISVSTDEPRAERAASLRGCALVHLGRTPPPPASAPTPNLSHLHTLTRRKQSPSSSRSPAPPRTSLWSTSSSPSATSRAGGTPKRHWRSPPRASSTRRWRARSAPLCGRAGRRWTRMRMSCSAAQARGVSRCACMHNCTLRGVSTDY